MTVKLAHDPGTGNLVVVETGSGFAVFSVNRTTGAGHRVSTWFHTLVKATNELNSRTADGHLDIGQRYA